MTPKLHYSTTPLLLLSVLGVFVFPTHAAENPNILHTLADGSTKQVSTDPKADYRYPHGEATPN